MSKITPAAYGLDLKQKYENFIGGKWVPPSNGQYVDNLTPVTGRSICQVPHSGTSDVDLALDAAHAARASWGKTSPAERALILNAIAERMEKNLDMLAMVETWDNGKPIRETTTADLPLCVDHFRYFAGCIRAQEGGISVLDENNVAYHFKEPLGVVAQIIPWNFPLLMACWKIAPALAAGNCIVLKPASATPLSILVLMELIGDLLPPGTLNVVNGPGGKIGEYLASSPRVAKVAFTGSTEIGRSIMKYAAENITPVTLELGGKSPNVFFADVMDKDDSFLSKALEGFSMFALNQGEICTCPSRVLVQESIYEKFIAKALDRVKAIKVGNPLDPSTMIGAQVSKTQKETILKYIEIGRGEGAEILTGGNALNQDGELGDGYYIQPTVLLGNNKMRVFQEEIFGPVVSVTTFKDEAEAIAIANDTMYGLGAGVWTRNGNIAYRVGRSIQAGRVWTNCYHSYPAHAAFGGYKTSGFGRETHKMILDAYQQTKCLLVSYAEEPLGFF